MQQAYNDLLRWIAARLREPTTYHGLTVLLTVIGVSIEPEKMQALIMIGSAVSGVILVLTKETNKP